MQKQKKIGLKINIKKTEVMRIKNKPVNGENLREADEFTYLGSIVSNDGGADTDIKSPSNKARHAFNTLRQIWTSKALSINTKSRINNTNVQSCCMARRPVR